jgi:hypothetical protein
VSIDRSDGYTSAARKQIEQDWPTLSKILPAISEHLAYIEGHRAWRKKRVYDHMEVAFGALMPDGSSGYTLHFYYDDTPQSLITSLRLSSDEMRELTEKSAKALEQEG